MTIKISIAQGAGFSSGAGYPTTSMITQGVVSYYRTTTQGANIPKWYDLNAAGTAYISRDSTINLSIRSGTATLALGTITIANTTVTANSIIIATHSTPAGGTGVLVIPIATRIAGVSFTIQSIQAGLLAVLTTDTGQINWMMIN